MAKIPVKNAWSLAFKRQAESDFDSFKTLRKTQPLCQQLHYLQMGTEKLAKSRLCHGKKSPPVKKHTALVRALQVMKWDKIVMDAVGMERKQFWAYLKGLLPIAQKLENLAPVGSENKPNPEYPWIEKGNVIAPRDYHFNGLNINNPKMAIFLKLMDVCLKIA